MTEPRFAGEPVELGGMTYVIPPLGLLAIKTLLPTIQRIAITPSGEPARLFEQLDDIMDICVAALRRNYPALSREDVIDLVDLTNFAPLVSTVVRQSGLATVQEKNGAAVVSPSTGPASTADSPPPSAGAGSTSTST